MDNFTFTTPRIWDAGGDMSKQWYVYFRAKNNVSGETKQFRFKLGINRFKKKRERQEAARSALASVISYSTQMCILRPQNGKLGVAKA